MKKVYAGKIYADWCPHCVSLEPKWENMKSELKKVPVEYIEIEEKHMATELPKINDGILVNSKEKLSASGFPTLFFIDETGNLDYYQGKHETADLVKWVKDKMNSTKSTTGGKKTKNTKKITNKITNKISGKKQKDSKKSRQRKHRKTLKLN
jgi:thiol-disulfide isomerase/thioredoxin